MQRIKAPETASGLAASELSAYANEPSAFASGPDASASDPAPFAPPKQRAPAQEPSPESSGLHKVTPATLKSLKTSYDQTSKHCSDVGLHWKDGRMARGSVNCLRILREVTLLLPRAGVAFGNDLAEHTFNILDNIADRFDGTHEKHNKSPVHHKEPGAKPKVRWLAIFFMLSVLIYCFNGLMSLTGGKVDVTTSGDDKDEKIEKAVEAALAEQLQAVTGNGEGSVSADSSGGSTKKENIQSSPDFQNTQSSKDLKSESKTSLSEKKLKKAIEEFVKEIRSAK